MPRLFISYSRADTAFADHLNTRLEQLGLETFIDRADINVGESWVRRLQNELDHCDTMLLLLSPESMASNNVEIEYMYFQSLKKPIFPLLVRPCKASLAIFNLQHITFHERDFEAAFADLKKELVTLGYIRVEARPVVPPPVNPSPPPPTPTRPQPVATSAAPAYKPRYEPSSVRRRPSSQSDGCVLTVAEKVWQGLLYLAVLGGCIAAFYFFAWLKLGGPEIVIFGADDKNQTPQDSGDRLAYLGEIEASAFIVYTMALDGTDIRQISDTGEAITAYAISPDGQQIALVTRDSHRIEVMRLDGRERRTLVASDADRLFGQLAWSPDGQWLAALATVAGVPDVYLVELASSDMQALTRNPHQETAVAWSPDSGAVAVLVNPSSDADNYVEIVTIDNPTNSIKALVEPAPRDNGGLAWAADSQLWFASYLARGWTLCSFPIGTSGRVEATVYHDLQGSQPAFSSDGRYLVYVKTEGIYTDLVLANADGSNGQQLLLEGTSELRPVWVNRAK